MVVIRKVNLVIVYHRGGLANFHFINIKKISKTPNTQSTDFVRIVTAVISKYPIHKLRYTKAKKFNINLSGCP